VPRSGNWHVDDTSSRQRRRSHRGRRVQGGSVVGRGIGGRVLTLKTVEYNTYTLHFSDTSGISKQKKVFAQIIHVLFGQLTLGYAVSRRV